MKKIKHDSKVLYDSKNEESYHGTKIRPGTIKFGKNRLLVHDLTLYGMHSNGVDGVTQAIARQTSWDNIVAKYPDSWMMSTGGLFFMLADGLSWSGRIQAFDDDILIMLFFRKENDGHQYLLFSKSIPKTSFFAESDEAHIWLDRFRQEVIDKNISGVEQPCGDFKRYTIHEWLTRDV